MISLTVIVIVLALGWGINKAWLLLSRALAPKPAAAKVVARPAH